MYWNKGIMGVVIILKGKCHNILQNTQMLTFFVLCSRNNISEFYSRIPYHLHNTAVIHSPLSHILPFFYVILHRMFFNDELVVSVTPIFGLNFLHIYHQWSEDNMHFSIGCNVGGRRKKCERESGVTVLLHIQMLGEA